MGTGQSHSTTIGASNILATKLLRTQQLDRWIVGVHDEHTYPY